jgi:hypothetical protein
MKRLKQLLLNEFFAIIERRMYRYNVGLFMKPRFDRMKCKREP